MYVDYEHFDQAATRLAELVREGRASVVLGPQRGTVGLDIQAGTPDVPQPGGGLYNDLDDALAAVISNIPVDAFVATRAVPRPPMFTDTEDAEVARKKYEKLVTIFPIAELRLRAHLRWTSSVPVFTDLSWEVLTRHAGSSDTDIDGSAITAPYAVLKLTSEQASDSPFASDREVAAFAMDSEAVEEVIETLGQLRVALAAGAGK